MEYGLAEGIGNVMTLTAPYALLVEAFGNDGDNPRDDYKSEAQWDSRESGNVTPFWEVYDYKVGKSYQGEAEGLSREEITEWHVQADAAGLEVLRSLLDAAVARLSGTMDLEAELANLERVRAVADSIRTVDTYYSERNRAQDYAQQLANSEVILTAFDPADQDKLYFGADGELMGLAFVVSVARGVRMTVPSDNENPYMDIDLPEATVRRLTAVLNAYVAYLDEQGGE